ncbi:hypothetical protein PR003_g3684 [Phytophthora rubi]|uniref:Crinkler effector protein N-terminal domain-containing protein n=1 Tax=Phytophthora rubi TaxID=129364 RepID=A0A6A3NYA8_9STRA|nr:hypothetical protein PR002_g3196 [Phytophthora rubi]KAE9049622.1 hypothetical protein PR001_g3148 [Phytophthora rubi]KAE9353813.1 hypothetical protein PR003_g3684 [Phytophthora rubi]
MVKLLCAIVGVAGSVFPVDIDHGKKVSKLKGAIKDEKMYQFPADELQLFLAKTEDGQWLSDDDALDAMLQSEADMSSFKKMCGSWRLDKKELFEPGILLGKNVVHVLVVVPEQKQQLRVKREREFLSMSRECKLRRMQRQLEQIMVCLPHKQSESCSDATLGQLEKERLKKDQLLIEFAPIENEEAFWSEETQMQADLIEDEAAFDAFVTPHFNTILDDCGLVFVNSAGYRWLSES